MGQRVRFLVRPASFLESRAGKIYLYINSGGYRRACAVTTPCFISPVATVRMGRYASMGLPQPLASQRFALPNSQIMIHRPRAVFRVRPPILKSTRARCCASRNASTACWPVIRAVLQDIVKATERDNTTPEEAKELGVSDRMLVSREQDSSGKSE